MQDKMAWFWEKSAPNSDEFQMEWPRCKIETSAVEGEHANHSFTEHEFYVSIIDIFKSKIVKPTIREKNLHFEEQKNIIMNFEIYSEQDLICKFISHPWRDIKEMDSNHIQQLKTN